VSASGARMSLRARPQRHRRLERRIRWRAASRRRGYEPYEIGHSRAASPGWAMTWHQGVLGRHGGRWGAAGRWSDAGLIVPDSSLAAARLGLVQAETPSAWFDRYVKAYVTAGDYLTGALACRGLPFDPVPLIRSLLRLHPREVYLQVLAAPNHPAQYPELADAWQERFLARLNPAVAENVRRALDGTADGMTRVLLARQPVLRAMSAVPTHRPPAGGPPPGTLAAAAPGLDPELAAMLLVHLVAAQLRAPYTNGTGCSGASRRAWPWRWSPTACSTATTGPTCCWPGPGCCGTPTAPRSTWAGSSCSPGRWTCCGRRRAWISRTSLR
jgi:hypothetical protein